MDERCAAAPCTYDQKTTAEQHEGEDHLETDGHAPTGGGLDLLGSEVDELRDEDTDGDGELVEGDDGSTDGRGSSLGLVLRFELSERRLREAMTGRTMGTIMETSPTPHPAMTRPTMRPGTVSTPLRNESRRISSAEKSQ